MSGNQTEPSPSLALMVSDLPFSGCQYPKSIGNVLEAQAEDLGLLTLHMPRSEEPNATSQHLHHIQLENSQTDSNSVTNPTEETQEDLKTVAANVAVLAIGVSIPGIFGIGQPFRGNQVTKSAAICLSISLLLFCTSFTTGIFLFLFSKTRLSIQNLKFIIQFLLWSTGVSTFFAVLLGAFYIVLHGLKS